MTALERPHIGDDGPAVVGRYDAAVSAHQVFAVSDGVKKLSVRLLRDFARAAVVQVSDDRHAELARDSLAVTLRTVARSTINSESLLAAFHHSGRDWQRD